MSQLKEAMPTMEETIANLRQQVNSPHVMAAASVAQAALAASVPSRTVPLSVQSALLSLTLLALDTCSHRCCVSSAQQTCNSLWCSVAGESRLPPIRRA